LIEETSALRRTVLIVDDNPTARELAAEAFAACGWDVAEAYDAPDAVAVAFRHAPSLALALIDVRMPGQMDGVALARLLKEILPGLRVVLTSGVRPVVPDSFAFLQKPWREQDLVALT
jgi:CheY-like chemotaxis protein